jgi:hypothetical protein
MAILLCCSHWSPAAEDAPRTWSDGSGRFSIQAKLLQRNETHVQLGTADGRKIAVPVVQLSQGDRDYLKSLETASAQKNKPAVEPRPSVPVVVATPPGPELLQRDASTATAAKGATLPDTMDPMELSTNQPPQGLPVDPVGDATPLVHGVLKVAPCDAYDKVSQPYVVDGSLGLVALSITRNKADEPDSRRGRVFLGNLQSGKVDVVCDVPGGFQLLDFEPDSGRSLAVSGFDTLSRGGDLVLFDGLADGKMEPLFRRQLPGMEKPGFKPLVNWARLLSAEHAACVVDSDLYVWNLRTAKLLARIDKMDSSHFPALSPNRRYMAVPRSGGAVVLDVVDMNPKGVIPFGTTLTPGVVFDPQGRRVGLTTGNQFLVWDCVEGHPTSEATLPANLGGQLLGWLAPDSLLTGTGKLIRTDLEMTTWSYSISGSVEAQALPGGVLLAKKVQGCEIASMPIPHAASEKAAAELQRGGDAMMLVRPGSKVSLDAEVPADMDREEMIAALREALAPTGWQIVNRAETTIVAQIGRGEKQELSYQMRKMGESRESGRTETATITPFTAEIQIRRGGEVLWTRKTQNHVPGMLFLRGEKTLQEAVKKFERPNTSFFTQLTIPPRIPKPEIADGLGLSSLDGANWRDISTEDLARARRRAGR